MRHGTGGDHIGRRLREIRLWRGMSLAATAELAGFTGAYLSMVERGLRTVERRGTLEALANALQVAPSELTGAPLLVSGMAAEHPAVAALRLALAETELGEPVDAEPLPWPEVAGRLAEVNALRPRADYAELGLRLPDLIRDLHVSVDGPHRHDALVGLVDCYLGTLFAVKNLGVADVAHVAARHVRDVAAHLSGPQWEGLAAWARAHAIGATARERSRTVALAAADAIAPHLDDDPAVADVYGSLHLTAALAATTLGRTDDAHAHVTEALDAAARPGSGTEFGLLSFGPGNVQVWRTLLAVEQGDGGHAVRIARAIDPDTLPAAPTRRAAWWIDIGRGLAMDKATRNDAVRAFRTAEDLAPQRVRSNPFVREIVVSLLGRARRDAGGRELRGLAHRMGVAG
ncbi:MAG: helix-turn-helix transcriptional regulator [Pseudonocardia sp.]|nr:helix-turn-helix transcriptional regulator [Pseudonocardia sp.]